MKKLFSVIIVLCLSFYFTSLAFAMENYKNIEEEVGFLEEFIPQKYIIDTIKQTKTFTINNEVVFVQDDFFWFIGEMVNALNNYENNIWGIGFNTNPEFEKITNNKLLYYNSEIYNFYYDAKLTTTNEYFNPFYN